MFDSVANGSESGTWEGTTLLTRKMPLLISVPHFGVSVPDVFKKKCALDKEQLARDGDEGAAEVFIPLKQKVVVVLSSKVARTIVDLNRAPTDMSLDGVVKQVTASGERIYNTYPSQEDIEYVLRKYYYPFHQKLYRQASRDQVRFCLDCHTMSAVGPVNSTTPGESVPRICIGNGEGFSCSRSAMEGLQECLMEAFGCDVGVNRPLIGGHIVRSMPGNKPWAQIGISREPWISNQLKARNLYVALRAFSRRYLGWEG